MTHVIHYIFCKIILCANIIHAHLLTTTKPNNEVHYNVRVPIPLIIFSAILIGYIILFRLEVVFYSQSQYCFRQKPTIRLPKNIKSGMRDGVSLKTPRPRGWVGAGRPSGCKSSFNKRNMYQYPHVSQLFILLPWQSRVYPEPLKVVEFVQLTTECCWGQPSDPCQRGCLTSHACVMWGPRTLNADDDDDDIWTREPHFMGCRGS